MDKISSLLRQFKNLCHLASALLAHVFYQLPAKKIKIIGVTGTDGKTTTVHLIYEILRKAGKKASMISSIYAVIGGEKYETGFHVTTPSALDIPKYLRMAEKKGSEYLVLEVTSHALDQNRIFGIDFLVGVITNITPEHLDYHKTYDRYFKTKLKLLRKSKTAIINKDDISYGYITKFAPNLPGRVVTFSLKDETADFTPQKFPFKTKLSGDFNQYNCLSAIACARMLEVKEEVIKEVVASFSGVKGRMEEVYQNDFSVMIDFAHTPNALEQVLSTVRPKAKGRLIHVFGSAGLRDQRKRPLMGETSAKYSDVIVLTAEDPRTENVNDIINQIIKGCWGTNKKIYKIPDRQKAVDFAVSLASSNDLVIITGKGHEKSMCFDKKEYPWSDHEAVKKAIKKQ